MPDPAQHPRSYPRGSRAECVAHGRVPRAERACPDRVDAAQVAGGGLGTIGSDGLVVGNRAGDINAAGTLQDVRETETGGLGDTPGRHEFAAHAIDRAYIPLEHGDR